MSVDEETKTQNHQRRLSTAQLSFKRTSCGAGRDRSRWPLFVQRTRTMSSEPMPRRCIRFCGEIQRSAGFVGGG
eukprot:SAG31_NODE_21738_length_542_cov_0.663657_1_plen_73_part_10